MTRKWLVVGLFLAVGATLIWILASGIGQDPREVPFALKGQPAPSFALKALPSGEVINFDQLKGKPLVINFWASWCQPCKLEYPELEYGSRALSGQATFIGIVHGDTEENALAFLKRYPSSFKQLMDPSSGASVDYGIAGVPETYFIDKNGIIRHKHVGPIPRGEILAQVRRLGE